MAYISTDQFKQLLHSAPTGTDPGTLALTLQQRGHTIEGLAPLQPSAPVPAAETPPPQTLTNNSVTRGASAVGDFLGMGAFGRGLAYAGNELTGQNQAVRDKAQQEQNTINSLPKATVLRLMREGKMPTNSLAGNLNDLTTGGLTNKQVIGSALSTAMLAGGGALSEGVTAGRYTPAIAGLASRVAPVASLVESGLAGTKLAEAAPALGRATAAGLTAAPIGAAQAGAVTAAQGGTNKDIARSTVLGGLISGALPFAFEGGKSALKATAKGVNAIASFGSGQGSRVNEELAQRSFNGDLGAAKEFMSWRSKTDLTDEAKQALDVVREARNTAYQKDLAALQGPPALDISGAQQAITDKLQNDIRGTVSPAKAGGVVLKDGVLTPTAAKPLAVDLSQSKIAEGAGRDVVSKVHDLVTNWSDTSVLGVDSLKQQLGDIAYNAKPGSKEQQFAIAASKQVQSVLDQNVPGYSAMTSKYATMNKAIKESEAVLGLGKKKATGDINIATALNKLITSAKDTRNVQWEALQQLSQLSGKDLTGMVVGASSKPVFPESGIGRAALGVLGPTAILHPQFVPAAIGTTAMFSPKLLGTTAILGGAGARQFNTVANSALGRMFAQQGAGVIAGQTSPAANR